MNCKNPVRILKNLDRILYPDGLLVPCGKCLNCRIQKRSEWALRLLHESEFWYEKSFITLTYDDDHIPENNSLKKEHLQLFLKRLRKNLGNRRIKYYACGEYGEQTQRPHYHLILFGVGVNKDDITTVMRSWKYADWRVPSIRKNSFGLCEADSIRYVCQYIDKKFTGEQGKEEYEEKHREPVFKIQSNGIGRNYISKYKEKIIDDGFIRIDGHRRSLPRYYVNTAGINLDEIKRHAEENEKILNAELSKGNYCTDYELYLDLTAEEYLDFDDKRKSRINQIDNNLKAKSNLRSRKKI